MMCKRTLKSAILALTATGVAVSSVNAQTLKTVDAAELTNGFANFFNLPADGGAFVFGQPWGVPQVTAVFPNATTVQVGATQVDNGDAFWIVGGTGGVGDFPAPGSAYQGNKISQASVYGEDIGGLAGQTLEFSVNVSSETLGTDYQADLFILDFAPGFGSPVEYLTPITGTGPFTVSGSLINDPARPVQWGIRITGPNVVPGDEFRFGSVVAGAIPEPSTYAVIGGLAALGLVIYRRRRA